MKLYISRDFIGDIRPLAKMALHSLLTQSVALDEMKEESLRRIEQ